MEPSKKAAPGANFIQNILNKNSIFHQFLVIPEIIAAIHYIMKDEFHVGTFHIREPLENDGDQRLHLDYLPFMSPDDPAYGATASILLDPGTPENGITRLVPGSHLKMDWPDEHIQTDQIQPDEVQPHIPPGGALVYNQNVWHGGGVNRSGDRRRTIIITFPPIFIHKELFVFDFDRKTPNSIKPYVC